MRYPVNYMMLGFIWLLSNSVLAQTHVPIYEAPKNNLLAVLKPFLGSRVRNVTDHSLVKTHRRKSDCLPNCPKVDIWKYQYMVEGKIIEDDKPISTRKEHWKHAKEARIITTTLFGHNDRYLQGFIGYLDSVEYLSKMNGFEGQGWGFESFTFRVYVAARHPDSDKSPLINATSEDFINNLLQRGVEVAYVDNHMEKVGLDATFWRFMIAAEQMPEGQTIRWLSRDVDWVATAAEAFSVAEWIHSGYHYHRFQFAPMCLGPLTATIFGGLHTGHPTYHDMQARIEHYPYRLQYGDDELFTRDRMLPDMQYSGYLLTHHYTSDSYYSFNFHDFSNMAFLNTGNAMNPYTDSCQLPTRKFCEGVAKVNSCLDKSIPPQIPFHFRELRLEQDNFPYMKSHLEYFSLPVEESERIKRSVQYLDKSYTHILPLEVEPY